MVRLFPIDVLIATTVFALGFISFACYFGLANQSLGFQSRMLLVYLSLEAALQARVGSLPFLAGFAHLQTYDEFSTRVKPVAVLIVNTNCSDVTQC